MELSRLQQKAENKWCIAAHGKMRVPAIIFASESLIREMDEKVYEQVTNVATLPGIVKASYAMPDAHWGYGFPIGGVAAFDADQGGVISAGGVGFDISCGVRTLLTGLTLDEIYSVKEKLADALFLKIPAGVGSRGKLSLNEREMNAMLCGGAKWAVGLGYGTKDDLQRVEEGGCIPGAVPEEVSDRAKKRQREGGNKQQQFVQFHGRSCRSTFPGSATLSRPTSRRQTATAWPASRAKQWRGRPTWPRSSGQTPATAPAPA